MLEALRPLHVEGLGVRIVSEFGWIIGQVPPALTDCPGCRAAGLSRQSCWAAQA
jgi:hypothetical protein